MDNDYRSDNTGYYWYALQVSWRGFLSYHKRNIRKGKNAFNQVLDKADPGLPGPLAGALGGSGGSALASTGASLLTSLLGGGTLASDAIVRVVPN